MAILSHFMLFIVRGWLALELTDSPFAVAAVAASGEIPSLLFSIPGGILADRISRKAVLIGGEIVNAIEFQGTSRPLERLRQILGADDVPATDRELSVLVAVARD